MNYISIIFMVSFCLTVVHSFTSPRMGAGLSSSRSVTSGVHDFKVRSIGATYLEAKPTSGPKRGGAGGGPKKKVKDDVIQVDGRVTESLPNAMFRVEIEPSGNVVTATISGKIRKISLELLSVTRSWSNFLLTI